MKKIIFLLLASGIALPVMAQKNKKTTKTANTAAAPIPARDLSEDGERDRVSILNKTIGPMHHFMVQWAGHWQEETTFFSSTGQKTGTYPSMRDGRMVMDGRFLVSSVMGERKSEHYEAESVTGWDNARMVFVKTWYDNTSTSILTLEGKLDQEKNIVEFTGNTVDPITRQPVQIRQVLKINDPTHTILEIFVTEKGREYKAMEVSSVRL